MSETPEERAKRLGLTGATSETPEARAKRLGLTDDAEPEANYAQQALGGIAALGRHIAPELQTAARALTREGGLRELVGQIGSAPPSIGDALRYAINPTSVLSDLQGRMEQTPSYARAQSDIQRAEDSNPVSGANSVIGAVVNAAPLAEAGLSGLKQLVLSPEGGLSKTRVVGKPIAAAKRGLASMYRNSLGIEEPIASAMQGSRGQLALVPRSAGPTALAPAEQTNVEGFLGNSMDNLANVIPSEAESGQALKRLLTLESDAAPASTLAEVATQPEGQPYRPKWGNPTKAQLEWRQKNVVEPAKARAAAPADISNVSELGLDDLLALSVDSRQKGVPMQKLNTLRSMFFGDAAEGGAVKGAGRSGKPGIGETLADSVIAKGAKGLTRDEFLGSPKITSTRNADALRPKLLRSTEAAPPEPFIHGLTAKVSPDGIAVLDGDKVVGSYNFGETLVVDPAYRKRGIAEEMVYQWRSRHPQAPPADARTKVAQHIQENVWNRLQRK
ncbi:MAG: hypothetical protein ACR652_24675 [Methylocystis sp.]|uniref:hypothetical protein n=1 Tax=Methylocystis sp. TaxID=1911079 RepID=UPI003DA4CF5D